jgi:hypothetical protein
MTAKHLRAWEFTVDFPKVSLVCSLGSGEDCEREAKPVVRIIRQSWNVRDTIACMLADATQNSYFDNLDGDVRCRFPEPNP